MSVIWASFTGLYPIILNTLVSKKPYRLDQPGGYLKAVGFLPITFLEWKGFLKIIYTCDSLCALKILFISYKFSSQSFAQSF